ncbi:MAG: hypothetical protein ACT4OX_16920 [Actinomycetota bacterium]
MPARELSPIPTAPEPTDDAAVRRSRTYRRILVTTLIGVLVLGVAGLLGVRRRTVTATGSGYELRVTYAQVTRPGLSVPLATRIRRAGGFDGPITVATDLRYLDMFDHNSLDPEPTSSRSDGERLVMEFDPPDGDTFVFRYDTRTGPNIHWGRSGFTSILVDDQPVVTVRYRTWVMP